MDSPTAGAEAWTACQGCDSIVYWRRWDRALCTCPECGLHGRVPARARVSQLLDHGSVEWLDYEYADQDFLRFTDTLPYPDRLAKAREHTGLDEAVICARGTIEGFPLVIAVMDFEFLGGSLGAVAGEHIVQSAETALAEGIPFLVVTASGGARMQEGAIALMQMAKTSAAFGLLDEAGILSISLITDPTFGGVAASFATLADVIIAEPGARLGFAGRRVIEQTICESLPEGFQTAEFLLERGFIDMIVPRPSIRSTLAKLLRAAAESSTGGPRPARDRENPVISDPELVADSAPWAQVRAARRLDRPMALDYLALTFDDFLELHGDRVGGDCAATVGGLALLDSRPVAVIGQQKGHDAAELAKRNYGMAAPAGYRKAARIMRLAAKLGIPVITLVDTPGAYPAADAETRGQCVAIAENLRLMMSLPVPVISVITGEGGSGGALGIAVANRVLMLENSVYSVITAEGCASILWRNPAEAPRAAASLGLNAPQLLRMGVVDGVIPEPGSGAETDALAMAQTLRDSLVAELAVLSHLGAEKLVADRRARFRHFGAAPERIAVLDAR